MAAKLEPGSPFRGATAGSETDTSAIQALMSGRDVPASVAQRAMHFIIHTLCAAFDQSYSPTSDRDSAFMEGRRFVALQIFKHAKLKPGKGSHDRSGSGAG